VKKAATSEPNAAGLKGLNRKSTKIERIEIKPVETRV